MRAVRAATGAKGRKFRKVRRAGKIYSINAGVLIDGFDKRSGIEHIKNAASMRRRV
jgi:hypothetical protein